jgi:GTP pyrophosphokinase
VNDEDAKRREAASENLRKMLLAMAQDLRVVLIKLADRLHNMQTLQAVPAHKRRRIALETMEVYAPLAERLGMGEIKGLLQDMAFPYVDPDGYEWVKAYSEQYYVQADHYLRQVMELMEGDLEAHHISGSVHGRAKHLYSLYKKLEAYNRDISKIYDLVAIRILVDDVPACYEVLGLLHQRWKPLVGRIKDYIAVPKPNGYQSLHTTVFCEDGRIVEFQVRTYKMHEEAEYGIAAHWGYKEGVTPAGDKFSWVQQLAKWQEEVASNQEFMEALKIDTFEHRIFVFTPRGEVKDLPAGATPLDFAYQIHSDIGNHCYGAKINGKLSHLSTELSNGDVVEIQTSPKAKPRPDWLDLAVTTSARGHIRKALREQEIKAQVVQPTVHVPVEKAQPKRKISLARIAEVLVEGRRGYLIHMASCCNPQPGDSIVGLVAGGKGISFHQRWFDNVKTIADNTKLVRISWQGDTKAMRISVRIEAYDKRGLTREIASMVTEAGDNIVGIRGDSMDDQGTVEYLLLVEVEDELAWQKLSDRLQSHPNIYSVERQVS